MTRIVFASCMSVKGSKTQPVWKEAAAHKPEWLILCGDNIYMDYWPIQYESKEWDPARFAAEMHKRYAQQFAVPAFRELVKSIPTNQVLGVWDDHDFAWNDCLGTDPGYGMPTKRKIATAMYHHYFAALNQRPLPATLPELNIPDPANPPGGDRDVYRASTIGRLRVLLCDGRSYREDITSGNTRASLLGDAQEEWLFSELAKSSGPYLLVTGSTMTNGDDQSWDVYQEFFKNRFLPAVRGKTVIFMAGDVHQNRLPPRVPHWPIEVVSSAAVLTAYERRFGVLEVSNVEANVFLYKSGDIEYTGKVTFATGSFKTSMAALLKDAAPKLSVQRAQTQRRRALRRLRATR
jgi:phosphodiesterase/alkaline phosphatase D-like protein